MNKFEILTPSGFQEFLGIKSVDKLYYLEVSLSNNTTIKCSNEHIFICDNLPIYAYELNTGTELDSINGKTVYVTNIKFVDLNSTLYDIIGVKNGNIFIINDNIITHNCDASFLTSGNSVISGELIKWYETTYTQEPKEKRGIDGNLWIWEYPDFTKNYMVVADVARGDGKDSSAFHVMEIESMTQVAEYKGQIGTADYGNMLVNVATEYNDALLVIENSNVGWAAIQPAIDRQYGNLFYSASDLTVVDIQIQINKGYDTKDKSKMIPGFSTTSKTRPLIISKLDMYMRDRAPIIRSKRLCEELQVFIWNGNKPEARPGYNDDLVMSFSIGLWVRDTAFKLRQQGIELSKRAIGNITRTTSTVTPVYNQKTYAGQNNPWEMNTGRDKENLNWLIG